MVGQHATFAYLWQWLGIQQVADMEPKPGVPPTPSHLQAVLTRVQAAPPVAVVHTLYQDQQPAQWLVRQLGEGKTTLLALASHVPLGRQVLRRGIVFIDLAIAHRAIAGALLQHRQPAHFERSAGAHRQLRAPQRGDQRRPRLDVVRVLPRVRGAGHPRLRRQRLDQRRPFGFAGEHVQALALGGRGERHQRRACGQSQALPIE